MMEDVDVKILDRDLIVLLQQGCEQPTDDATFNALALRLFAYQFACNLPYQKYCQRRGQTPETVHHWHDIPAVPIGAFKELTLSCIPTEQAEAVWMSSGTTKPERRSQHYQARLAIYNASMLPNFAAHVLPDAAELPMLVLNPTRAMLPHSSLAHYLSLVLETYGTTGSDYFLGAQGVETDRFTAALLAAEQSGSPVCILGASFAFVHVLDTLQEQGRTFTLPEGSRIMDTGGFKGQSRELTREELYGLFTQYFGIPESHCVNMYGMTEFSSQFLDNTLRCAYRGQSVPLAKENPPWTRTLVVDPETLQPVPAGTRGLLLHHDLANCNSVVAVLTEDVGVAVDGGFTLLGRAQGTETRGCSVAIDEMLLAAQR
ncbi:MAG: long-chain fatty acid--CoA ligase [Candidatus Tectomicrobia bacterium]|nr:long-chain fatty acid--CoA ligase [Candidatus Tectomicrobia bacterium]